MSYIKKKMINLRKINYLLSSTDKKKLLILLLVVFISSFFEIAGVVSIMPFIAILTNPDLIETNSFISNIYYLSGYFGIINTEKFLFFLGFLVFTVLLMSLVIKLISTYLQFNFINKCQYNISKSIFEKYLHQPYSWFLNRNSSDLVKTILSEVIVVVDQALYPIMIICVYSFISLGLIVLLFFIDTKIAFIVFFFLGLTYTIIFKIVKNHLVQIGKKRAKYNQERFIIANEAFSAYKEIKISRLENFFIHRFCIPAEAHASYQASVQSISVLPKFVIEAVSFGGMILLILILMQSGNLTMMLSTISVYAFAGYRLLPAIQQIYWSFSQLKFASTALDNLYLESKNLKINESKKYNKKLSKLSFEDNITLSKIHFSYLENGKNTLKNVNIKIPVNSIVGLAGPSGSGKTTTADIIMGLLKANQGTLKVDDISVNEENLKEWQKLIGYVPQNIYLSDDTVAANIAFGVNSKNINKEILKKVLKIVNLYNFVTYDLPKGLNTIVGERGARLSGGQAQRIGIARALYYNPRILILDEATNALDGLTEKLLLNSICQQKKRMTIIIITHKLETLKICKKIFYFENGSISSQGSFDELVINNSKFSLMKKIKKIYP